MLNLIKYREQQNLTQEELAEKSGLSVRTIQRIEAGSTPKGYTLKALAKVLEISEEEFTKKVGEQKYPNIQLLKLINISSLPFTFLPPLNVIVPLLIVFYKKEKHSITKQIITIQIIWSILATIIFMLGVFIRKWFDLNNRLITMIMLGLILCNVFIILRNAIEIDKNGELSIGLNFNML